MHANPSTAQPCAHTDDEQEHRLEEFKALLATKTQEQLIKIRALVHAIADHDLEALEGLINQSTNAEELALLNPVLDKIKAELAIARLLLIGNEAAEGVAV